MDLYQVPTVLLVHRSGTNNQTKQPLGGAAPTLAANDLSSARPEDLGALFVLSLASC